MHTNLWLCTAVAVFSLAACREPPPNKPPTKTPHRTDFAAEEFGIGRPHTKNAACNQEIDRLLNQIRVCYNSSARADCNVQQQTHSDRIARLKNKYRCRR